MLPEEMKHPHRQLALGGQALPCVAVLLLTALPCACADGDGMMKLPGWFLGAWGECDVSCGGGMQHRAVHCLGSYGQVAVLDLLCGAPPPEEDLSRPCNTHPCGNFYFEMGAWQACSEPCGGGTRGRATQCIAAGGGPASDESLCAGLEPNTAVWQSCNTAPCPQNVAYWSVGSWGICTAQCGPGFAYRTVSCMGTDGQPSAACKGPQPVAAKPCEITPCEGNVCSGYCGPRSISCTLEAGDSSLSPVCTCEKGWGGPRCTVPDSCSGVIDSGGGCCASGLLDASGGCCDGDGSGASPATDSSGNCCPSGFVDACGACGGRALAIDSRGECCSGALDAAGYCCPSGSLDACGVCGGSSEGAAGCPRDPECGDNVCQQEEGPWVKGANRCLEDCPLPTFDCPSGPSWAVRGRTAVCSDRGSCQVGQGRCSCFRGYDGKACSRCEAGWERSPSGACIPVVAPQQQTPALTPVSGGLQQNTTVPPEEASARGSLPTWALAAIIAGSVFLLAAGLAGMWCAFCLPSQAVQGLELYPASNVYGNRATVQSQDAVFTPGDIWWRRPYPNEPGWEPIDPVKPKPRPPSIRGPGAPLALQVAAMQGIQISTERQLQTSQLPQDHLINLPPAVPMQKLDSLEGYPGSLPALPPAKMPGCDFDHRNCQQRTQMAVAIASNPFGSSPGPLGDSPTNWMPHVPGAGVLIDRPTSRQHEARPASSPAAWRACRNPRPSSEQQTRKQRWSEEQGYTRQTRPGAQDPAQQLPGNADLHGQDPYQAAEVASGWGTWAEGSDFATVEKEQFLSTQKLLATDMDNARPGLLDSATASSKGALDPSSAFCGEIEFAEAEEGEKPSPEEKRAALSGRPRTRHNMAAKTIDLPSDDGEDQGNGNHSDIASSQPRNSTKENLSRKVTFYNRGTGDEDSERGEQRGGFLATMSSFFGGQSTRSLGGASTKSSARSVTHSAASRHSSTRSLANMASVMDDLPVPSVNPQHQSEDPEGAIMGGPSVMSMQSLFMDVDEALGEAQGTTSRMAEVSASYWAGGPVASLGSTTAAPPNPGDGEHDDRLTVSTQHYLLPGSTTGKT